MIQKYVKKASKIVEMLPHNFPRIGDQIAVYWREKDLKHDKCGTGCLTFTNVKAISFDDGCIKMIMPFYFHLQFQRVEKEYVCFSHEEYRDHGEWPWARIYQSERECYEGAPMLHRQEAIIFQYHEGRIIEIKLPWYE